MSSTEIIKTARAVKAEDTIDFEELVGAECDFYGCDGTRFRLDDVTYEYIERDSGYDIIVSAEPLGGLPIARVVIESVDLGQGYEFTDLHDGHEWLTFGTWTFISDVEPYFDYSAKAPQS